MRTVFEYIGASVAVSFFAALIFFAVYLNIYSNKEILDKNPHACARHGGVSDFYLRNGKANFYCADGTQEWGVYLNPPLIKKVFPNWGSKEH